VSVVLFHFILLLQIQSGRTVVPTALGVALIRGYQRIDQDLCLPLVRGHMENIP
jgi:DNA topoisomerase-3